MHEGNKMAKHCPVSRFGGQNCSVLLFFFKDEVLHTAR